MIFTKVVSEVASILYWMMLAACTVGPGTVVTCARAGAEFDLSLLWALVFATILAFILQEGTARLTIVSGMSLGQCLRMKYRHTAKVFNHAVVCWVVATLVIIGNTFYEANCFAGGIDAIMSIPGAAEIEGSPAIGLRVGACLGYAAIALVLLYFDSTKKLGICLGIVMISMVGLFLLIVCLIGLDWTKFMRGFIPSIPVKKENSAEPADVIMSLVGTTSLGFNLFLGGAMAKGKDLQTSQRGIALSVISALIVSVLILIVGAGFHQDGGAVTSFNISKLSVFIEQFVGEVGVVVFAVGFIAAAVSSMLTVPLGAAITADTVFSDARENRGSYNHNPADQDENTPEFEMNLEEQHLSSQSQHFPWCVYFSIMLFQVALSAIIIGANADRTMVILVAQTFNGCLLPFFSMCLLLCLNDPQLMSSAPQPGWANLFLVCSVAITLFLAANVVIQKLTVTAILMTAVSTRLGVCAAIAFLVMVGLCRATSLGGELRRSFRFRNAGTQD